MNARYKAMIEIINANSAIRRSPSLFFFLFLRRLSFPLFFELIYLSDDEPQEDPCHKRHQGEQRLGYPGLPEEEPHLHRLDIGHYVDKYNDNNDHEGDQAAGHGYWPHGRCYHYTY